MPTVDAATLLKVGRGLSAHDIGLLVADALDEAPAFYLQCIGQDSITRAVKGAIAASRLTEAKGARMVVAMSWVTVPGTTGQDISAVLLECTRV